MKKIARFTVRSGVFTCSSCGKKTRKVSESGAAACGMCEDCYECSCWANGIMDGTYTLNDIPEAKREKVSSFLG